MLFDSIFTSAAQHLAVWFAISSVTAQANAHHRVVLSILFQELESSRILANAGWVEVDFPTKKHK